MPSSPAARPNVLSATESLALQGQMLGPQGHLAFREEQNWRFATRCESCYGTLAKGLWNTRNEICGES
jgi:hypothetical protein